MAIQWAPWNVPMHRRLEVLSLAFAIFFAIGLGPLAWLVILYLLIFGNIWIRAVCLSYIGYIYYDRNAGNNGGRGAGIAWTRNWIFWKYYHRYFPLDLVKTVELPANRNYLICLFPHGVLAHGAFGNFLSLKYSKWPTLFPGVRSKCTTLNYHMCMPIVRDVILSWGVCSASSNALKTLLSQSTDEAHPSNKDGYTSNAVVLMVGGAQEALSAFPKKYRFFLKNRKGFVRIALTTGAPLVPAISFGENDLFEQVYHPPGSFIRCFQDGFKRLTKIAPVHLKGRGLFQYSFGLIPRRHPITTVIGGPLDVVKNPQPSDDEVDAMHTLFCERLLELFETHKHKYVENYENVFAEIE